MVLCLSCYFCLFSYLFLDMTILPLLGWLSMSRSSGLKRLQKRESVENPNSFCLSVLLRLVCASCLYCECCR